MKVPNLLAGMTLFATAEDVACGIQGGTYRVAAGDFYGAPMLLSPKKEQEVFSLLLTPGDSESSCEIRLEQCLDEGNAIIQGATCHHLGKRTAATDILDNITSLKLGFNNILDLESKHDHLLFIRIG
eukprot:Gregarina_sp_Poly_1__2283@NODE_1606_length_3727_cov_42_301093_g1058_i0_p2_GENE_NODE_1606_length_3727_cov_42_301093_g1058_i0NODE_1606_length_3727_cov_42_301093_g1058_i0_p2_ORF_typecomplete_len127_score13_45_NODE_1606_length_3727_cov_42_301093_g1058_i024042784